MNRKWIIPIVLCAAVGVAFTLSRFKHQAAQVDENMPQAQQLVEQAMALQAHGQMLEAKAEYQKILAEHPDFDDIETIQSQLGELNIKIVESNTETPQTVLHKIQAGDSLGKLAKEYNTTQELIKKSNNLSGDVIRLGQKLRIWKGNFQIHVDKSRNILILKNGEEVLKVYNVSTGTNNSTPVGKFKITIKLVDPVWFKSGAVIPPESPENVLGSRWMGFDLAGYGIHGTTEPDKIGLQATAGCVRMLNRDIEELYTLVPIGTVVTVVD